MNIVAVETSGRDGSIALLREGQEPIEQSLASDGKRHAQTLVADADSLLSSQGLGPRDTNCVAVSLGPGSFTGLRVGIVFAKTFGWINKCPIVAIPTFEVIAAQSQVGHPHVCVVGDAQRGEVFFGEYAWVSGAIEVLAPVQILTLEAARDRLSSDSLVTGPGLQKYASEFNTVCAVAPAEAWAPRAGTVATLGEVALGIGDIADPWKLEPFYLRRSAAEEKRDAVQP